MIAFNKDQRKHLRWQNDFVVLLPHIERLLKRAFSRLDPDKRDEAIQCATVFCLLSYMRLHRRGRVHVVTASTLVWYAIKQTKCGRPAVGRMNSKELMSSYGQLRRRLKGSTSQKLASVERGWIEQLVEDKRAPVPDQVAARLDVGAWISTLSNRSKLIAADLASGFTTSETAAKYYLSAGRISQLRRQLQESWMQFSGELAPLN